MDTKDQLSISQQIILLGGEFFTDANHAPLSGLQTCRLLPEASGTLPSQSQVRDGHIRAIIDWDFAGSFRLSEVLGGTGWELFELDENLGEYGVWNDRMRDLLVDKARD